MFHDSIESVSTCVHLDWVDILWCFVTGMEFFHNKGAAGAKTMWGIYPLDYRKLQGGNHGKSPCLISTPP
jgi:hypothetical protein